MKKLTTSSKAFQKISRCYFCTVLINSEIKTNVLSICEVLSADVFTGLSCNTGKILLENICQINASIVYIFITTG